MAQRILFVCLGNICRSPAAEGALQALRPVWDVDSAGTAGWHVGKPPYGPMQTAAAARGLDLSRLRARQVGAADFDRFDLMVAMDAQNRADLEGLRPAGSAIPVVLLTDYAPALGMDHVPDPYYTRDFEGALDLIMQAVAGLARAREA